MVRNPQCGMPSSRGHQDCSVLWIFKMEVFGVLNKASKQKPDLMKKWGEHHRHLRKRRETAIAGRDFR